MKYFDWNESKNALLKTQREMGFEDVIIAIDENRLLDVVEHPHKDKYPGQKIFVVEVHNYVYLVPFAEDEEKVFLKTIIPSRKATRDYLVKR